MTGYIQPQHEKKKYLKEYISNAYPPGAALYSVYYHRANRAIMLPQIKSKVYLSSAIYMICLLSHSKDVKI